MFINRSPKDYRRTDFILVKELERRVYMSKLYRSYTADKIGEIILKDSVRKNRAKILIRTAAKKTKKTAQKDKI